MASVLHARITFTELVNAAFAGAHIGLPVMVGLVGVRTVIEKKFQAAIISLRNKLSKKTRHQLGSLLVLYQEQLSVLNGIVNSKNPLEAWAAEARFHTQCDGTLKCKIDEFVETIGDDFPSHRMLVVTSLTRIARRAYMKALHSGHPLLFAGPAGTGKTETAKDITFMLGREAIVFNCNDIMTPDDVAAALAKIPKDTRAPLIFDEFNRIATKVQKEIVARIEKERPGQFVIVTADPGYAGRSPIELPGLQTVPFTKPDFSIIAEAMLGFEGISNCAVLGKSLINCIQDCRTGCTKQDWYDFGLRAIKSIITLAGAIARDNGYTDEASAVRQAVGCSLYFRATAKDKAVVAAAVKRAFGVPLNIADKFTGPGGIAEQIVAVSQVRHAVCIVGATDPKALMAEVASLSGAETAVVNVATKNTLSSAEGALFKHMQAAGKKNSPVWVFLILPPAAEQWPAPLQPLHTLFDDNKKMYFDNGQVVSMTANQRFFVVTEDCSQFSPAGVSRMGVVNNVA